jgi:large subunit ribosomal protein L23
MAKEGEKREYTFVVAKVANKNEVRQAVARRFNVTVENVRMLTMPGKERRRGRTIGWKSGFKKAVVVLAQGQTIEMQ